MRSYKNRMKICLSYILSGCSDNTYFPPPNHVNEPPDLSPPKPDSEINEDAQKSLIDNGGDTPHNK